MRCSSPATFPTTARAKPTRDLRRSSLSISTGRRSCCRATTTAARRWRRSPSRIPCASTSAAGGCSGWTPTSTAGGVAPAGRAPRRRCVTRALRPPTGTCSSPASSADRRRFPWLDKDRIATGRGAARMAVRAPKRQRSGVRSRASSGRNLSRTHCLLGTPSSCFQFAPQTERFTDRRHHAGIPLARARRRRRDSHRARARGRLSAHDRSCGSRVSVLS